ncbi:helix-turn-helix domain-containing protein [Streptomyces sp. NPDC050504]|uniref:helix-turn-helix domain-containing protein n=1 Tax=Streptomyces sp. NPDC050504 TaxID=3365618 RepID=UPI00379E5C26
MPEPSAPAHDRGETFQRPAPAWLRDHVVGYRGYRSVAAGPTRLTLPAATVTLVLGWGAPVRLADAGPTGTVQEWSAMLAGLRTSPVRGRCDGLAHGVEVEFTPLGAYALLALPLRHLSRTRAHPDDVLGLGWTRRLTERLATAPHWRDRWRVLDSELAGRLAAPARISPAVAQAWDMLTRTRPAAAVADLVAATGLGHRRLQSLFGEQVGLPPSALIRVLRFQRALAVAPGARNLADLAAACGYYDQAHLNHDFRALSGRTPAQLSASAGLLARIGEPAPDNHLTGVYAL